MSTPAWINVLAEEGSRDDLILHIKEMRKSLKVSVPNDLYFRHCPRPILVDMLVWAWKRQEAVRFDVV